MKKIILYCVFFLALVVETSCGSRTSDTTSEKPALPHKTKGVDSEQKQAIRESLNITFEDVLGNRQKLKTEEVNKNDVGAKLCDERIGCFVEDNHFYFKTDREDYMNTVIEVFQDKGKKLGEFDWEPGDWLQNWGKYGEKLYLVLRKENELSNEKQTVKFISVNLNSWKTEIINCFEIYGSFLDVFVYNEKIYINDLDCSENLDEIDMNGEKTRTISLGDRKSVV